jgi:ADP-heptose:LPS heptosyltransferase
MNAERIIISRTDHIGDVVLTFPMVGLLRRHYPSSQIVFLGRNYTQAMIEACDHVDEFLAWDAALDEDQRAQAAFLEAQEADVIIHVYPEYAIAAAAKRARVPTRVGTSHRLYHLWTCNRRVSFTRRRSELHEAQLNAKLLAPMGIGSIPTLAEIPKLYGLTKLEPPPAELAALLSSKKFNVVIHPMTAGNAKAWSLDNYTRLIETLQADQYDFFVTGVEDDRGSIERGMPLDRPNVTSLVGRTNLKDLLGFISAADAIVCASTGPLHVAAALGKCAIGFYQPRGIGRPGRYGPVGRKAHSLVYNPSCERCLNNEECDCLQDIPVTAVQDILEPQADAKRLARRDSEG